MTLASLRDCFAVPLEWTAKHIAARPKATLILWFVSLAAVAWLF